eukprot:5116004-Pyramimonas_sp.AAC.1
MCREKTRTHSMFADDAILVAKSGHALGQILVVIEDRLGRFGLQLNADKCDVQSAGKRALLDQKA